jgi:hypothetical protein
MQNSDRHAVAMGIKSNSLPCVIIPSLISQFFFRTLLIRFTDFERNNGTGRTSSCNRINICLIILNNTHDLFS